MTEPNEQHQFDILYMPHNHFEGNMYKYILTGIDVASRYNVTRPLKTKKSSEVAFVLEAIYSFSLSVIYLKYLYRAYVTMPVPTATNDSSPFLVPLMDGKNQITEVQVVKALFVLQILDIIQALPHQHC